MAGELDEAEALVRGHSGMGNDDIGAVLTRLVRQVRLLTERGRDLEQRVRTLEAATAPAAVAGMDTAAMPAVEPPAEPV